MAIPIAKIKEGCCDSDLSPFTIIYGDSLDNVGSTCDKIIECDDKYVLIEEKSLLLAFFDSCCKENSKSLEHYKDEQGGTSQLKVSELITLIQSMNIDVKKRIFSETVSTLLSSSLSKVSNTTHILATNHNNTKTANMPVFYMYCNSGTAVDSIMHIFVSQIKRTPFIECSILKNRLLSTLC